MKPACERWWGWRLLSPLGWPFVLLYAMAARLKNAAYDFHLTKPCRLRCPVIAVGNLSVGGTGKTPFVMVLAKCLQTRGWSADVLSRGYGRSDGQVVRVDPQGDAQTFGDEPLLLARRGIAVYVGAERMQAGLLAESDATGICSAGSRALHLLDDGFQHRRLARAVDIVLLDRADLTDEMLPLGRLREPLCSLERADICVLRAEDADLKDRVLLLMRCADASRVWIVERRTTLPALSIVAGGKALAFCALARPHNFFDGLSKAGLNIVAEMAFRDHHAYTHSDIDRLKLAGRRSGANYFVTTEKDSMRLSVALRTLLEQELPLLFAGLEVSLHDEATAIVTLESMLAARTGKPL